MPEQTGASELQAVESSLPKNARTGGSVIVTFLRSNLVAEWDPSAGSLLDFAESKGLSPAFCCRAGVCGTCLTTIQRGSITYFESPVVELAPGEILLCCSRPAESVDIDI
jgi:uncharacterized protein